MSRLLSYALVFLFSIAFADDEVNLRVTADVEPLASAYGCVNVVSGDFFQGDADFVYDGPEPFSFERSYSSSNEPTADRYLGLGQGINIPLSIKPVVRPKHKRKHCVVSAELRTNCWLTYQAKTEENIIMALLSQVDWRERGHHYISLEN